MKDIATENLDKDSEFCNDHTERRNGVNRRTVSQSTHHHRLVGGMRESYCRRSEQSNYFVDRHSPVHFAVVASIMLLSVFDAFMTTMILSVGGEELNLLMDSVIRLDIRQFVQVKLALTGFGLILLTRYIHFKVFNLFKVFHFMVVMLICYSVLIVYELSIYI